MQSHGKTIIREYHRKKFWGKVKNIAGVTFWKSLFISEVALFFVAGVFSTNVLLTHLV